MKKTLIIFSVLVLIAVVVTFLAPSVNAHPGRTDSRGGHTNHSTGEYHYHHGYSAHDHYDIDGDGVVDCPYDFDDKTDHSSKESATTKPRTSQTAPSSTSPTTSVSDPIAAKTQTAKNRSIGDIIGELIGIGFILLFWAFGALIVSGLLGAIICKIIVFNESAGKIFYYVLFAVVFAVGSYLIISNLYFG